MKISITVKTTAKREVVAKQTDGSYRVAVKAPPIEGRANENVIRVLADYFRVPKSGIRIVSGLRGKRKLVEVTG